MKYTILQLATLTKYGFMDYEYASQYGFSLNDYKEVYSSNMQLDSELTNDSDVQNFLEDIFCMFNIHIPTDFKGHSLSVSDLIKLEDGRIFYVDSIGFKEIK